MESRGANVRTADGEGPVCANLDGIGIEIKIINFGVEYFESKYRVSRRFPDFSKGSYK